MSFSRKDMDNQNMQANDSAFSELKMDELDIRTHLNDSLDLKGITMSEDLIQRTLEAVRQSEAAGSDKETSILDHQKEDKRISKKLVPWYRYIRIVAGATAAVFVVAAGLNFFNGVGKKGMDKMNTGTPIANQSSASTDSKNESDTEDSSTSDSATYSTTADAGTSQDIQADVAQDKTSGEGNNSSDQNQKKKTVTDGSKTDTADDTGDASDDNIKASSTDNSDAANKTSPKAKASSDTSNHSDDTDKTWGLTSDNKNDGTGENSQENADTSADSSASSENSETATMLTSSYLSFQEIAMAAPEAVISITITDETNKTAVTITDQEIIKDFYTVMDQQKFVEGSVPSSTVNYTIRAISAQDQKEIYTLKIGESITVSTIDGNVVYENTYQAVDETRLISNLGAFFQKNSR